ncbi:LLM class F420-dependent oxidoreductase [soil metagenome]
MTHVSFGIKTAPQHISYDEIVSVWQEAESIEVYEHAWLFDHFAPIVGSLDGECHEGWTTLAALAAITKRLRLGLMVTGNTYRHPAVLAKIASTVDVISNGRLEFGIGAGWNEYEHTSMGIPLYAPGERIARFGEACDVIKSLFTQPLTTYDGQYYQLKDARLEPKPVQKPYPPFMIGGSGEKKTLRVVAKHADYWNFTGGTVEDFTRKVAILHEHCAAVGRNPAEIKLSHQLVVDLDKPTEAIETIKQFVDAGVTHYVLYMRSPFPEYMATRLAEEVILKANN